MPTEEARHGYSRARARAASAVASFDLNCRENLSRVSGGGGGPSGAVAVLRRIVEHVDVLVENGEGLQKGLGIPEREAGRESKLDSSAFVGSMSAVTLFFPGVKAVASTLREVRLTNRPAQSAVAWVGGRTHAAPTAELDVMDRVGGGDGFAWGVIDGRLSGAGPEEAVRLGWAHGALLTAKPGDTTIATLEGIRAFARGGSARIQR